MLYCHYGMPWESCSSMLCFDPNGEVCGPVLTISFIRGATDKRTIVENYDLVALTIDETIDDGIILETDPVMIASRVSRAPAADAPNMKNIDLTEQGLMNAWEFGKRRLAEGLRQM